MSNLGQKGYGGDGILSSNYSLGGTFGFAKGGGYDANAQAFFTAIEGANGTLTTEVKDAWNTLVLSSKQQGLWSGLFRIYPHLGGKISSAVIDAITLSAATNVDFLDADVNATCGITSDGVSKHLVEPLKMDNLIADPNDLQWGFFVSGLMESASGNYHNGYISNTTTTWISIRGYVTTDTARAYTGTTSSDFPTVVGDRTSSNDSFICGRYSEDSAYLIYNGTEGGEYTTPVAFPSMPADDWVICGGVNNNGSLAGASEETYVGNFMASGWTLEQTKAFEGIYRQFLTDIGTI